MKMANAAFKKMLKYCKKNEFKIRKEILLSKFMNSDKTNFFGKNVRNLTKMNPKKVLVFIVILMLQKLFLFLIIYIKRFLII